MFILFYFILFYFILFERKDWAKEGAYAARGHVAVLDGAEADGTQELIIHRLQLEK
jgi:hypothetical protein